jgi:hypothetical protein
MRGKMKSAIARPDPIIYHNIIFIFLKFIITIKMMLQISGRVIQGVQP